MDNVVHPDVVLYKLTDDILFSIKSIDFSTMTPHTKRAIIRHALDNARQIIMEEMDVEMAAYYGEKNVGTK